MVEEVKDNSPANNEVLNKYKGAADLANKALTFAVSIATPGASILDICRRTDEEITSLATKVYQRAKVTKGISFPCCVSVNNVICYCSPADATTDVVLKDGDLVKIELGAHIDNFPALVGTTLVVGAGKDKPAVGPAADLAAAANTVAQGAVRLLRDGKTSNEVCDVLKQMCSELGVKFVEGMISHSVTRNKLADEKLFVVVPAEGQTKAAEKCQFALNDVFVIDVALSHGEGKVQPSSHHRTTIYKRTENNYALKLKTSRVVVSEVQTKFGQMGFNIRHLQDATRARVALNECTQHGVTSSYDVLEEKKDVLTARIMFTAAILSTGTVQLTDYQFNSEAVLASPSLKSQNLIDLLNTSL